MRHRTFMAACTLSLLLSATSQAQRGTSGGQWPNHSGDKGSTKYAPLDQINRSNVRNLHVAWRRPAVADELRGQHQQLKFSNLFRSTPLMINGALYASDGVGLVEAFDPATGRTLWVQESTDLGPEALAGTSTRGIAYWRNGADERLLSVRPRSLYAINLKTGELIRSFGEAGKVDLRTGLGPQPQPFNFTSAPLIVKDIAVIGSSIADNPNLKEGTRGDVRGYDVKTGKLRWTFRTIPREREFGVETWEDRSWEYTGAANAWSNLSADEELGYIYLPLTAPTSDMYGGHRLGNNLFSNSLVCVRADTGQRVWHFQLVHHDLWDYDLPAAPILADITAGGKPVKAVVQVTKEGFAFVFDRVTGQPVWPIEERPVPNSTTPGERTSPTQPFPTKPAAFERQGVSIDDLIDFTPELRAEAVKLASLYKLGPIFTPPVASKWEGPRAMLMLPSTTGGANWQGGSYDPDTGIMYIFSNTGITDIGLVNNPQLSDMNFIRGTAPNPNAPPPSSTAGGGGGEGGGPALNIQGLPLVKPPYGRITAIDLNKGEMVWQIAHGETPDNIRNHPALKGLKIPQTGRQGRIGTLVTKTLLIAGEGGFFTTPSGQRGAMLRAYDKANGQEVGSVYMPAPQTGSPMTYMLNGKQHIIVSIGGGGYSSEFIAFRLRN